MLAACQAEAGSGRHTFQDLEDLINVPWVSPHARSLHTALMTQTLLLREELNYAEMRRLRVETKGQSAAEQEGS